MAGRQAVGAAAALSAGLRRDPGVRPAGRRLCLHLVQPLVSGGAGAAMNGSAGLPPCPLWPVDQQDELACLNCPIYPEPCIYDTPSGRSAAKGTIALKLIKSGSTVEEIQQRTGLTRGSVYRLIRELRAVT